MGFFIQIGLVLEFGMLVCVVPAWYAAQSTGAQVIRGQLLCANRNTSSGVPGVLVSLTG